MDAGNPLHASAIDDVPRLLIERGWKQGTMFRAQGAELWSVGVKSETGTADSGPVACPRATPSDGRFVVVSQTCDIAAPLDREPVVEAIACAHQPDPTTRASYRNSFRWFEIDRTHGLVAHAVYRVPFDKRALLHLTPASWPDTPDRLTRFSTWLARRASRAAIPDPIVKAFVSPLKRVLDKLEKRDPVAYQAFMEAVGEIRIGLPYSEDPPFEIPLVLLLDDETGLGSDADDAIEVVRRDLMARLNPREAKLIGVERLTRSRMSVKLYFDRTALVDFDALTYVGDDIMGAEPSST